MTEIITTTTDTRATQLRCLIDWATTNGYTGNTDKLEKVVSQWNAPRSKPKGETATHKANKAYAEKVYEQMTPERPIFAKDVCVMCGFEYSNKATPVMKILVDSGKVVKGKHGKLTTYTRI